MASLDQSIADWIAQAGTDLAGMRNPDGGWAYRAGDSSSTEPTALASLALSGLVPSIDLSSSLNWITSMQRSSGFWSASPIHSDPSWTTPLAGMASLLSGSAAAADRAMTALLDEPVYSFPHTLVSATIYGYDTSIPGWPWTSGDYSFTEPTAFALIFLKRRGQGAVSKARDAVNMLRARRFPNGTWNYGETNILSGDLFPTVAPTALGLLALADEPDDLTSPALDWLAGQQGQISSLFSLGWAAIALNVLGRLNDAWRNDIVTQWKAAPAARRDAMATALCLLAFADPAAHPFRVSS